MTAPAAPTAAFSCAAHAAAAGVAFGATTTVAAAIATSAFLAIIASAFCSFGFSDHALRAHGVRMRLVNGYLYGNEFMNVF